MKVFFTWHGAVLSPYRKYMEEIVQNSDAEMTVLFPDEWYEGANLVQIRHQDAGSGFYRTIISRTVRRKGFDGTRFYYRDLKTIISNLRNEAYDIIHVYEEPWSLCALQMLLLKSVFQPKARFIFQSYENIKKSFKFPYNKIESIIFKYSHAALAFSEEIKHVLQDKGFNKNIHLITQGTDTSAFKKKEVSGLRRKYSLQSSFTIGYAGRLSEAKGLSYLMDAFSRLKMPCRLLLIGTGPYKQTLLNKARDLNIHDKIIWLENISNEDISEYYSLMDALVLPSVTTALWKEQFGRVLVEAMLCGVPVIGSDSGEIPHVIGDAGLIFPEKNTDELTRLIETLQQDTKLRQDLIERGKKRAQERFTWKIMAQETVKAYHSILAQ